MPAPPPTAHCAQISIGIASKIGENQQGGAVLSIPGCPESICRNEFGLIIRWSMVQILQGPPDLEIPTHPAALSNPSPHAILITGFWAYLYKNGRNGARTARRPRHTGPNRIHFQYHAFRHA